MENCIFKPKPFTEEKLQELQPEELENWLQWHGNGTFYLEGRCEKCSLLDNCFQIQTNNYKKVLQELHKYNAE